ncbi:hypothetical protein Droror1_Dr00000362 [Drosera rotundifolia]
MIYMKSENIVIDIPLKFHQQGEHRHLPRRRPRFRRQRVSRGDKAFVMGEGLWAQSRPCPGSWVVGIHSARLRKVVGKGRQVGCWRSGPLVDDSGWWRATGRGGRSLVVMEFMVKPMVVGRDVEEKEKRSVGEDRGERRGTTMGDGSGNWSGRRGSFGCVGFGEMDVGDDDSCPLIERDPRLRLGCARVVGGRDRSSTTPGGGGLTGRGGRSLVVMEFMVKLMVVGRDVEEKEKRSVGEDRGERRGTTMGDGSGNWSGRRGSFGCVGFGEMDVGDDDSCPLIERDPRLRLGCARVVGGRDRSSTTPGGGGLTGRGGRSLVVMEFMVKLMVVGRDVEEKEKRSVGEDRGKRRGTTKLSLDSKTKTLNGHGSTKK